MRAKIFADESISQWPTLLRLTKESGWHTCTVNSTLGLFADTWSSKESTVAFALNKFMVDTGEILWKIDFTSCLLEGVVRLNTWSRKMIPSIVVPIIHKIRSDDGKVDLFCAIYLPPGVSFESYLIDNSNNSHVKEAFPAIVSVYGGPHVQRVSDNWALSADMRAQRMTQQGIVVVKCDNRGSYRRGVEFEGALKHDMGRIEVQDQVTVVEYLVRLGLVDASRVGMFGWSYGGYMSAMSLCRAPETFCCAVAGAPVTSWDGYDTHYTERYMGLPQNNSEGYSSSSVMTHVGNLQGQLMLVHGLIDENVHFRHTARLINSLIMNRKRYELILFPCERHSPHKKQDKIYLEDLMFEFFMNNLTPYQPVLTSLELSPTMATSGLPMQSLPFVIEHPSSSQISLNVKAHL